MASMGQIKYCIFEIYSVLKNFNLNLEVFKKSIKLGIFCFSRKQENLTTLSALSHVSTKAGAAFPFR